MPRIINDLKTEQSIVSRRFVFSMLILMAVFAVILTRYSFLQVTQYEQFLTMSESNRVHLNSLSPQRGRIYSRDNQLLAQNSPSFVVTVVRGRMNDVDTELGTLQTLLELDDETIAKFKKRLYQHRPYDPVPMRYELTEKERAILAVNRYLLPGISVSLKLIRQYTLANLTGHIVGYVGRISDKDKKRLEEDGKLDDYLGAHHIGKTGLERYYEDELYGKNGYEQVETNAHGKVLRSLDRTNPISGNDLTLHLDLSTQKYATELMQGELGAIVAIDVKTGGIVTMVSMPGYDTNLFVNGISHTKYNALRDSLDRPLFNRAIHGTYPPASTVKPFYALAGLQLGVTDENRTVPDPGWYRVEGDRRKYRDWKRSGHGRWVNMAYAIKQSCDVYFYDLAYRMGIDRMHPFMNAFGFGKKTGVDYPFERKGVMPSKVWKKKRFKKEWYPGDSLNAGIGQGFFQATPLQIAAATAVIANRGKVLQPHFVKKVGKKVIQPKVVDTIEASPKYWNSVIDAMVGVIHSRAGTARRIEGLAPYIMAGKTGTAQVVGIKQGEKYDSESLKKRQRDHALFMGFAPAKNPQVAIAVIVENGESGGKTAAPIAAKVVGHYLKNLRGGKKAVAQTSINLQANTAQLAVLPTVTTQTNVSQATSTLSVTTGTQSVAPRVPTTANNGGAQ